MSENTPRRITDAQIGLHKNLEKTIQKHFENPSRKPIAKHTQQAFDGIKAKVEAHLAKGNPLIFDSCCGTAMSTQIIATQNSDALVIGIDRSAVRLTKSDNDKLPSNVLLVQAECSDFWWLAKQADWVLQKHFILYPNPYPKSKHLKRRWHGHPAFPVLLSLGGELQVRSNWRVYIEEFCTAANYIVDNSCKGVEIFEANPPLTLFEKKYHESGQQLYRCKILLKK